MSTPRVLPIVLVVASVGCASDERALPADPNVLAAIEVHRAPAVDGRADDEAWAAAPVLTVPMEGQAGPAAPVELRAVVHGGDIYLLARWADATQDREHKLWTPKASGGFAAGPEREDVFAISFPISGEFTGDMLAPVEATWDVWQWKSARTDPAGFAMDKSHRNTWTDPGGKRSAHPLLDGRTLHIARPEDAGTSATRSVKAPASGTATLRQYEAQTPAGSAADVVARATWSAGGWTLEMRRSLDTGHGDDAVLRDRTPFAVATLDHAEDEHHVVSPVRWLSLPAAPR